MKKICSALLISFALLTGFVAPSFAGSYITARDANGIEKTKFLIGEPITFLFVAQDLPARPDNAPADYAIGWNFGDGCAWHQVTYATTIDSNAQQYKQYYLQNGAACPDSTTVTRSGGPSLTHVYGASGTYTVYADIARDYEWIPWPQYVGPVVGWVEKSIAIVDHPDILSLQRWATQQGGFWNAQKWMAGDFNGDGLTDLVNVFNDGGAASIDVHISTNGGFIHQRWATQQGGFSDNQKWMAGDFNGDGLADLVNVHDDGGWANIDVHVSTNGGFIHQRWATHQGGFWDTQQWVIGDFNGDRLTDLAKAFDQGGLANIDVHISTNGGFIHQRWATQQGGFSDNQKWMAGDFNGDGMSDMGKAFNDDGLTNIDVHLSASGAFVMDRWATRQGSFWDAQKWVVGDFNKDGYADFAKVFDEGGACIDVHRR